MIAEDARVSLSLLLYHFRSKERLWKAVIDDAMLRYPKLAPGAESLQLTVKERLREIIRAMVLLFSEIPALHRVITQEAHRPTPRLIWLCETYAKPDFKLLCDLLAEGQREGTVRIVSPMRLRFAMVAIAAVPFSVAAEYQYLAERNPFSAAEIEGSIELIERLVFEDDPHHAE